MQPTFAARGVLRGSRHGNVADRTNPAMRVHVRRVEAAAAQPRRPRVGEPFNVLPGNDCHRQRSFGADAFDGLPSDFNPLTFLRPPRLRQQGAPHGQRDCRADLGLLQHVTHSLHGLEHCHQRATPPPSCRGAGQQLIARFSPSQDGLRIGVTRFDVLTLSPCGPSATVARHRYFKRRTRGVCAMPSTNKKYPPIRPRSTRTRTSRRE